MDYDKDFMDKAFSKLKSNLNDVFGFYEQIIDGKFEWDIFIKYQNILMESLFELKKHEFKLKKMLKDIKKNNSTIYSVEELNHFLGFLEKYENRIKTFGDFLATIFYINDEELIKNHFKQEPIGINSIGSGTFSEIKIIKTQNTIENNQFYIYNNITSLLRLGDVSVFDKLVSRIIGYGEIKSSVPNENSRIKVTMDIVSRYKLPHVKSEKIDHRFLNDDMKNHLEKQLSVMKENLIVHDVVKHIDNEIKKYHYDDFEKLIIECDKNGHSFMKISDNIAYFSVKDDFDYKNNMKDIIDLKSVESLVNKEKAKERRSGIAFTEFTGIMYKDSLPFLLLPISRIVMKLFLEQSIFIVYSYDKIITELEKCGFSYYKRKKKFYLTKQINKGKFKIELNTLLLLTVTMLIDEDTIINSLQDTARFCKSLKPKPMEMVIFDFINTVNAPKIKS